MAVITICLTCYLIFVAEAQDQDLGQGRSNQGNLHTHYTRFGTITGRIRYTDTDISDSNRVPGTPGEYFYSFTGVPYATPPISNMRFQEAEPRLGWHGDLDATQTKNACPRPGGNSMMGLSEDCLYLNIFTKNLIKRNNYDQGLVTTYSGNRQAVSLPLRPVIVFLPAFENQGGAASFGGSRLMREDLVVVTVEYRTGILGFLSDETKKLPGNLGLADVSLALSWVQQAIAEFGGNPQSVTLAGYGQGAVIAHLLSLNRVASNQFQKLILLSGSSMCRGSVSLPYTVKSDLPSPYYIYKCLQDRSLAELLRAQTEIEKDNIDLTSVFVPMVDNHTRRSPLVEKDPISLDSTSLNGRPMPMMLGSVSNEGLEAAAKLYLKNQGYFASSDQFNKKVLPPLMKSLFGNWKGRQSELKEAIYRQYFNEVSSGDSGAMVIALGEMLSDVLVNSCLRQTVMHHQEHSNSPVFSYIFAHSGAEVQSSISRNIGRVFGMLSRNNGMGVTGGGMGVQYGDYGVMGNNNNLGGGIQTPGIVWRGDDLLYLWQMESTSADMMTMRIDDKLVSQNITNIWASFAKLGYPQLYPRFTEGLMQGQGQQLLSQDWPVMVARGPLLYYNISFKHPGLFDDYRKPHCVFWQYQMEFYENLANKSYVLQGYAVATYVLLVAFFLVTITLTAGLIHYRKRNLSNEKALHTRDYNSWVANMNNMKAAEAGQNNYEIK